jgi:hypothetical protein
MRFVDASSLRLTLPLSVLLLTAFGANAQTAPELQTYRVESTVPLAQIGATPAPTLPVNVVQAVQGGALEIRHSVIFTASTRRLSVRTFLVPPGSPNPTPPAAQTMTHESYEVNVENILWAPQVAVPPGSTAASITSVVFTGRIAGGSQSLFGDLANKLFVHTAGLGATSTAFNNVTTVVAGTYTIYVGSATGSISFAQPGGGQPGGPSDPAAPKVVATAGMNSTTTLSEIQLDASGSTDPGGGVLTYSWRAIGKSAAVIGQNTAKPSVQFGEGFGEYVFEVTVTNARGLSSMAQVRVLYVGR